MLASLTFVHIDLVPIQKADFYNTDLRKIKHHYTTTFLIVALRIKLLRFRSFTVNVYDKLLHSWRHVCVLNFDGTFYAVPP